MFVAKYHCVSRPTVGVYVFKLPVNIAKGPSQTKFAQTKLSGTEIFWTKANFLKHNWFFLPSSAALGNNSLPGPRIPIPVLPGICLHCPCSLSPGPCSQQTTSYTLAAFTLATVRNGSGMNGSHESNCMNISILTRWKALCLQEDSKECLIKQASTTSWDPIGFLWLGVCGQTSLCV